MPKTTKANKSTDKKSSKAPKEDTPKEALKKDTKPKDTKKDTKPKETKKGEEKSSDTKKETKKETKKGRFADVTFEKGAYPNKETAAIKGTFNVKNVKKDFKEKGYKVMGAQFALVTILESLTIYIVNKTIKFVTKDPTHADMYKVTLDNIKYAIQDSSDLNRAFSGNIRDYTPLVDWSKNVPFSVKEMDKLVEKYGSGSGSSQIVFDSDARNFLLFLLSMHYSSLIKDSDSYREYAKKTNINFDAMIFAVKGRYRDSPELLALLLQKLDGIKAILSNETKRDDVSEASKQASVKVEHSDDEAESDSESDEEE